MPGIFLFVWNIALYTTCFILLLVVGAFVRLIFSRETYSQVEIDKDKLRKGDVILTGTNKNLDSFYIKISNILTNGIKNKYWVHAALHIGDGKLIEACPQGIVNNSIDDYLEKGVLVKVYRNKYAHSDETLDRIIDFCEKAKEDKYSYGWVGLFFYVLASFLPVSANFIFDSKTIDKLCNLDKAYFCSELIADAYKETGQKITPFDSWRVKPSDFVKNPFFVEIL